MPKTRDTKIRLPATVSPTARKRAVNKDKEAAVVTLQQEGELTIREAAEELALTYEQYLDLLAQMGLPASYNDSDPEVLESLREWMRTRTASST